VTRAKTRICSFCLVFAALPARAAEVTHKAGDSETLESIAKNYYGATWKSVYIQAANGLTGKDPIAGKKLVIPGSWSYVARRGDTVATIAKKRLGAEGRYTAIMRFNNIKDPADLEAGRELLMPFHLTHVVVAGDTLERLSRHYYRTTKYATLIKDYNGADSLKAGGKLTIPIFDNTTLDLKKRHYVAPTTATDKVDSGAPPEPVLSPALESAAAETRARIDKAIVAYNGGEFAEACPDLNNIFNENQAVGNDRIPLYKYLGFCAVAFADVSSARDFFRKWMELDPKASLDPVTTSPKILAVFYEVNNEARPQPSPVAAPPDGATP
jgi:LysM repeat protein